MELWFTHSLIALIALGGMTALYKIPGVKGHDKSLYVFLSFVVATILSLVFFYNKITLDSSTILFGFLWGSAYALLTLLQVVILKRLDTNASLPITSLSSNVLIVLLGIFFFKDNLSLLQILGVILSFLVIGFYNYSNKHITLTNGLLPVATAIVLISTFTKSIQKFGAISGEIHNFIFWQFFFALIASLLLVFLTQREKQIKEMFRLSWTLLGWGSVFGMLSFIGTVELVKALSMGPISLVYIINSFYIFVASFVAWLFFGEKLTRKKILFVSLAILILLLIRLG